MRKKPEPPEAVAARNRKARAAKRAKGLVTVRVDVPAELVDTIREAAKGMVREWVLERLASPSPPQL